MPAALIGGGLALLGSQQQADSNEDAARIAAQAAQFDPYNVYASGIGSAQFGGVPLFQGGESFALGGDPTTLKPKAGLSFGRGGGSTPQFGRPGTVDSLTGGQPFGQGGAGTQYQNLNIQLDPQMEAFRQRFLGQAGQTNPLFQQTAGLFGQAGQNFMGLGGQTQGIGQNILGVGQGTLATGADLFGRGGSLLGQGQGLFGQGQSLLGQGQGLLNQAVSQDPTQVAQTQFDKLNALIQPQQQQARTSLENRLFAQGRLGGTGGQQQFESLLGAQGQQQNQLAAQALGQGQQVQQQAFNQGLGTLGAGQSMFGTGVGVGGLGSSLFGQGQGLLGLGTQQFGQGANLLGQGAGQFAQGAGLFGQQTGIQDQQFASQLNRLNAARTLAQDPLQLANMGIGIGGRQSAAGASVAPLLFQAGQSDPMASALMGFGTQIGQGGFGSLFNPTPVPAATPGGGVAPGGAFPPSTLFGAG